MTGLGMRLLRAGIALQVAALDHEDEDVNACVAHQSITKIAAEITQIAKAIRKADTE